MATVRNTIGASRQRLRAMAISESPAPNSGAGAAMAPVSVQAPARIAWRNTRRAKARRRGPGARPPAVGVSVVARVPARRAGHRRRGTPRPALEHIHHGVFERTHREGKIDGLSGHVQRREARALQCQSQRLRPNWKMCPGGRG